MGFRFRKSFGSKFCRLNLSGSGISVSTGVPGLRASSNVVSFGGKRRAPRVTASIPGTGLSYGASSPRRSRGGWPQSDAGRMIADAEATLAIARSQYRVAAIAVDKVDAIRAKAIANNCLDADQEAEIEVAHAQLNYHRLQVEHMEDSINNARNTLVQQRVTAAIKVVVVALVGFWLMGKFAHAETVNAYDPGGRKIGSSSTVGGGTTNFYDAGGRKVGSSSRVGGGTTNFYDAEGRKTGSTSGPAVRR